MAADDSNVHVEVRRWDFINDLFSEKWKIGEERLDHFYLTPGRKLVFIADEPEEGDEVRGFYMQIYRFDYEGMEELCDDTEVVRVAQDDFERFSAATTRKQVREYAEKHHMPALGNRTKIFAMKWKRIYNELKERDGVRTFHFNGYSRHKILTTGSIWGYWK